jgi:hypothetical protein
MVREMDTSVEHATGMSRIHDLNVYPRRFATRSSAVSESPCQD